MCELLGMNCNTPTDICFSFSGFQARGGATGVHSDGWGIGFFEGKGTRVFLDPQASCQSPIAELVRRYPIRSTNVVAHIRKATQGVVALENTHPFVREAWGRYWLFAHNGNLGDELGRSLLPLDGSVLPVGNTDSERAFCTLMQALRSEFPRLPSSEQLFFRVAEWCRDVGASGECNFLLSNGDFLLAHCSTRLSYIVRRAPFATAHLKDEDVSVDFSQLTTPNDCVAVIATEPLTDNEVWQTLPAGTLWWFANGEPQTHCTTVAGVRRPPAG